MPMVMGMDVYISSLDKLRVDCLSAAIGFIDVFGTAFLLESIIIYKSSSFGYGYAKQSTCAPSTCPPFAYPYRLKAWLQTPCLPALSAATLLLVSCAFCLAYIPLYALITHTKKRLGAIAMKLFLASECLLRLKA